MASASASRSIPMSRVAPRFEQHPRVAAEADRAIDEHAAALRVQERPHLVEQNRNVPRFFHRLHAQIPKSDERRGVVIGERLGEQPRDKPLVVPDLEKGLLPQHVDFARHQRALAQPRLNQHAALRIELGGAGRKNSRGPGTSAARDAWRASARCGLRSRPRPASDRCERTAPVRLVTKSSRRDPFESRPEKPFGTLSRPLSSIFAGELPRSTSVTPLHSTKVHSDSRWRRPACQRRSEANG